MPLHLDEAIVHADGILSLQTTPPLGDSDPDPRWQAIIAVGEFVETQPEAIWLFILRWGASPDADIRAAIATCLLEHLLESMSSSRGLNRLRLPTRLLPT